MLRPAIWFCVTWSGICLALSGVAIAERASESDAVIEPLDMAIAYAAEQRVQDAKYVFGSIEWPDRVTSDVVQRILALAEEAYAGKDWPWAGELFEQASRLATERDFRIRAESGRAWCAFQMNRFEDALAIFGRLRIEYPEHSLAGEAAWMQGRILQRRQQFDAALAMYHRVARDYSDEPEAHAARLSAAFLHVRLDQWEEARTMFEELLAADPPERLRMAALYGSGLAFQELGRDDMARHAWRQLLEEYPAEDRRWAVVFELLQHAMDEDSWHVAERLLRESLPSTDFPEARAQVLYWRGHVAARRSDWQASRVALEQFYQEFPQHELRPWVFLWLGEAEFRARDWERASIRWDELEPLEGGLPRSWQGIVRLRRAQAAAHRQDWNMAWKQVSTIGREFPDFRLSHEADLLAGRCLLLQKKYEAAREAWARVGESPSARGTKTAALAQFLRGESYFEEGKHERALLEYARVETRYPDSEWQAAALFQSGRCREYLGEMSRAARFYSQVQEHPLATETLKHRAASRARRLPKTSRDAPTPTTARHPGIKTRRAVRQRAGAV